MNEKAVALAYDKIGAPRVVAAGKGEIARNLIKAAQAEGIPIQSDVGLVEALLRIEVGQEIPLELYKAVAELLAFIYKMDTLAGT